MSIVDSFPKVPTYIDIELNTSILVGIFKIKRKVPTLHRFFLVKSKFYMRKPNADRPIFCSKNIPPFSTHSGRQSKLTVNPKSDPTDIPQNHRPIITLQSLCETIRVSHTRTKSVLPPQIYPGQVYDRMW